MTEDAALQLTIQPEFRAPEIPPEFYEAIQRIGEQIIEIGKRIMEGIKPVIECAVKVSQKLWEGIVKRLVPEKWWRIYKHTKSRRIRKKYEKRIRETVLEILKEVEI